MPDLYLSDFLGLDMIIGRPLLYNYYTIFNFENSKVGIYKADYTKSNRELTRGAMCCLALFIVIPCAGIFACFMKLYEDESEYVSVPAGYR
mgnify:CR=1 FL=1